MATKDIKVERNGEGNVSASPWLWSADFAIHELEKITKTKCGYGVVKSVSPNLATESLRKGKVSASIIQDEMPSFFLSETLKYFYLAFDEGNLINTDKERNWIFTTEAHPIHHVPMKTSFYPDPQKTSKPSKHDRVKKKIVNKLKMRIRIKTKISDIIHLESKRNIRLENELWSKSSTRDDFSRDLKQARPQPQSGRNSTQLFGRLIKKETEINFATVEHAKNGRSSHLTKSCPNFHHSNALWIQALTGAQIMYPDLFASRFANDEDDYGERIPSALISSALLGLPYEENAGDLCPLNQRNSQPKEGVHPKSTNVPPLGSQRIDMGHLGHFDISVYNGEGFFIKHAKSGESIEATIIEKQDNQEPFVAIEAYVPAKVGKRKEKGQLLKSLGSSFSKLKSVFVRKKDIMLYPTKIVEKYDRKVFVSDMQSSVYSCTIEILQASGPTKEKIDDISADSNHIVYRNKKVLSSFPCLPATYGPTELNKLNQGGKETYEATLYAPDESDPFGCEKLIFSDDANNLPPSRIDLVERGICNFRSKAINLSNRNSSEAIIIINTEGGKLFVMSGTEEEGVDYSNEPASVLVTKEDGDEIIKILNEKKANNGKRSQILARIRLQPQPKSIDQSQPDWPLVITEPKSVQILASQNWGVTAKKDKGQWQIYILQHDGGKNPSGKI